MSGGVSMRRLRRRDARLVPVAAAAWLAAAGAITHPGMAGAAAAVLWACAAVAAVGAVRCGTRRSRRVRRAPALALAAVALAASAAVCTHVAAAAPLRAAAADLQISGGRALTIDAVAVGKIERSADGFRFDALLERVRVGDAGSGAATFGAGVPVVVRSATAPRALDLGARLRTTATAWPTDPGERAVLVVDATGDLEITHAPSGIWRLASDLRRGLGAVTASLPAPGGGLIPGLAVGDTSGVGDDLDAAMKDASLSHLTAVSGANCALIVGIAFGAAALCRARRGVRVACGVAALTGFVVLVSPEPSVVRAAAMAAIAMLGVLLGRPGAGLALLTSAVVVVLLCDPWLALSIGFALSAAATGALLVGAGPLADGLARWMPHPLALGLAVPLAAQLVCGPLIVLISPRLSVYGVIANVIAAPAAPVGTVLGLAACLTAGIPLLGSGVAALAWIPAAWIAQTAATIAALPGSVVTWPEGPWGLAALAVVGAAVAGVVVPVRGWLRPASVLILATAGVCAIALGPIAGVIESARLPTGWAIAACDVGQGDAVLVRSAGSVALIDTGPDPAPLAHCLDVLGIGRIDLLVLTHFDADHRGGVSAVQGRVGTVLHGPVDTPAHAAVLEQLAAGGARPVAASRGMSGPLGDSRWSVLWPRPDTAPGNDASVVVQFDGGGVPPSLFLGDLSAAGQRAMKAGTVLLDGYAVVKVAHHGSADQDPGLYGALRASLALVTVGENDYGHPRAETLDLLTGAGTRVARTDVDGLIAVWSDADGLRLWRDRAGVGVAPDG